MGNKAPGKHRSFLTKLSFKGKKMARHTAAECSLESNDKNIINKQHPEEICERRKKLFPYYKSAKRNGKRANLVCDKLYVNGNRIEVPGDTDDTDRGENIGYLHQT